MITLFFSSSFVECLANLSTVLRRCEEVNLILSWERNQFVIQEGIVLECLRRELRFIKQRLI